MTAERAVYAAGTLCWRISARGVPKILVVSRPGHNDVSLPKGKVDPGETLPQTAVRETYEETGLAVRLGAPLGVSRYTLGSGRTKIVHYWAAEISDAARRDGRFTPNHEISAIEWVTLAKAKKALSYQHDVEIVDAFESLLSIGAERTFSISILRHAKAVSPSSWEGPDESRPLSSRGRHQAKAIVSTLRAFGVDRINTSDAKRCQQTVAPLARALGVSAKAIHGISQDAFETGIDDIPGVVRTRLRTHRDAVICSHGPVIPALTRDIAIGTGSPLGSYLSAASALDTSAFTVIHISSDDPSSGIIAIETYPPLA